ncbi:vWA domain-containing protein [Peribacillus alkalitolerans]|uniref:vWA domain-containing protein n=1 Tax=Peribacillus alkalitolerans TaxID=1550385 RepID=UPI0013D08D9D|nr:VWA domain-containing protein [Peribacillus alkalitolerans]
MLKFKHLFVSCLFATLILNGCSKGEQISEVKEEKQVAASENPDKKNETENSTEDEIEVEVEPLPNSYQELEMRPVGEYNDFSFFLNDEDKKMVVETFSGLPDLSKESTNKEMDQFYNELLSQVQEEYKGPEEAIRQLKFQAIGDPQMKDSRYQFKENLNVEIILDASGSMAQKVNGTVKMEAAKESIMKFVQQLPKEAKVGLRVYGHKGSNADSDQQISCSSSEIMYPISTYNETQFTSSLGKIKPTGWTPTGLALKEAQKDLSQFDGKTNTNIVYLVSDGISTCEDNPIQAAKDLYSSNISPIVNVIGFDVDSKGQNELKQIADVTEGLYANVADESELNEELEKINNLAETWKQWKNDGLQRLEGKKIQNDIDIFVYITKEEVKAQDEYDTISLIVFVLWEQGLITDEAKKYLDEKNSEYHDWIKAEVEAFKAELKTLNEKSYIDAIKTLEEKYQQNTQ